MKALKLSLGVIAAVLGCWHTGMTQTVKYVTLYAKSNTTNQFALTTNQVVFPVGYGGNTTYFCGNLPDGTTLFANYSSTGPQQTITGLTNIFIVSANVPAWSTLQITTPATATTVSNYVPADAIVIPASAAGNVQIILESSTDLLNWTAASPGTYGASSTTNRFFRVRATVN